jgi:hypothetical protein
VRHGAPGNLLVEGAKGGATISNRQRPAWEASDPSADECPPCGSSERWVWLRRGWLGWLDQLPLVLSAVFLIGHEARSVGVVRLPRVAEFRSPWSFVDVSVVDAAVHINRVRARLPGSNSPHVDGGFCGFRLAGEKEETSERPPDALMRGDVRIVGVKEVCWKSVRTFHQMQVSEDAHLPRGRLPEVSCRYGDEVVLPNPLRSEVGEEARIINVQTLEAKALDAHIGPERAPLCPLHRLDSLPQAASLSAEDTRLQKRDCCEQERGDDEPTSELDQFPIIRRFLLALLGLLGGFGLSLRGLGLL